MPAAALAKNKRPSRAAAAEELLPAVTAPVAAAAEVVKLELATGPEVATATETAAKAIPPDEPHAPAPSRPGLRRRMAFTLRLNRTLEASLVVAGGSALAVALAFGGLGARGAAQSGIPLDTAAHATPTPSPVPTVAPTPTLKQSVEPSPLPSDSSQPGASGSPNGSAIPSAPPTTTPVKTAAPIRTIGS